MRSQIITGLVVSSTVFMLHYVSWAGCQGVTASSASCRGSYYSCPGGCGSGQFGGDDPGDTPNQATSGNSVLQGATVVCDTPVSCSGTTYFFSVCSGFFCDDGDYSCTEYSPVTGSPGSASSVEVAYECPE